MMMKLDWTLNFWFWKELIIKNRCLFTESKKSVSDIIIELLEKESSNLIEKSEHVVVDVSELWAFFLIDDVIAVDSADAETFFNRANAKFQVKDYKGAVQDYTSALALDTDDKECYY